MSDIGLNLRGTSPYVTDPANTTYFIPSGDVYPVTRGGFTFGTTAQGSNAQDRDRNAGIDARLAGVSYNGSAAKTECELDLSAGNYDIQLACGDYSYTRATIVVEVLDNTISRFTINGATTGSNRWLDALGAQHDTTWVPSSAEAKLNQSISSGTLKFKIGDGVSTDTGYLAHIRATTSAGGGGTPSRARTIFVMP